MVLSRWSLHRHNSSSDESVTWSLDLLSKQEGDLQTESRFRQEGNPQPLNPSPKLTPSRRAIIVD